jgi:hypothetical protein
MTTITRFEEIEAWQTARELTKRVYSVTDEGKISRDYGLKDQIRRASVSVMAISPKDLKAKRRRFSSVIWGLQKRPPAKSVPNYMSPAI